LEVDLGDVGGQLGEELGGDFVVGDEGGGFAEGEEGFDLRETLYE
jgi:hypothetical protein